MYNIGRIVNLFSVIIWYFVIPFGILLVGFALVGLYRLIKTKLRR